MAKLPYLTTHGAAKELGISVRRVQQLIGDGRLPTVRAGRVHLIRPQDLDAVRDRPNGYPAGRPRKNPDKSGGSA